MHHQYTLPVEHVTETAWMVAAMRLLETRRADACFNDELAATLMGDRVDELLGAFSQGAERSGTLMSLSNAYVVARTYLIDQAIEKLSRDLGVQAVLNLGVGLDTRPYRLHLPKQLNWYEADYAVTISLKEQRLAHEKPCCNLRRIAADLANDSDRAAVMIAATAGVNKVLILTEGLLPYLPEQSVRNLAAEIHSHPACEYWMMDYANKAFYEVATQTARARAEAGTSQGNVKLQFAPESMIDFMEQNSWDTFENSTIGKSAAKLDRLSPGVSNEGKKFSEVLEGCGVAVFTPA